MWVRLLSILLATVLAVQAAFGGLGGAAVLCLGGGHRHTPIEAVDDCDRACEHENARLIPAAFDHDTDRYGCVDLELPRTDPLTFPRTDPPSTGMARFTPTCHRVIPTEPGGLAWCGPPTPPWFDPGGEHRLALVSSTRMTI